MKKAIHKKIYDTDKARSIGRADDQELFRKKTGEFFFLINDTEIKPLEYSEAASWTAKNLDIEIWKSLFAIQTEGKENVVKFGLTLTPDTIKQLKRQAQMTGKRSVSQMITEWVNSWETH